MPASLRSLAIAVALLWTGGGVAAGSVSASDRSIQACTWGAEKHSTIHAHPNQYSSWINVVYYKTGTCAGIYYMYVTRIDTRFATTADPPYLIQRKIVYLELKRPDELSVWTAQPTNKSCYNACVIQATFYPNKTIRYANSWWVKVTCQTCWPATNEPFHLFHYFVKGTYTV